MSILTNCPVGAALPDVPVSECDFKVGQIQKLIIQRIFSSGTTRNKFVKSSANPNVKASWTPLLSASNGIKVVQTPYINSPSIEPGKAVMAGSGNDALGGIEMIIGKDPSIFTGKLLNITPDAEKALQSMVGETIGVYMVDEHGIVWGIENEAGTEYSPIEVGRKSFFVGDRKGGMFNVQDENEITFKLPANWSNNLVAITPTDFNALTDLATINS